jgi:outer membrane protein assembly factor BamB
VVYGSGTTVMAVSSESGAVVWKFSTGGLPLETSPTLDDAGDVYVTTSLPRSGGQSQVMFALHGATGAVKWSYVDSGSGFTCNKNVPLFLNGVVYWSCSRVYGFRADTGAVLFAVPVTWDVPTGMVAWDGAVIAASDTVMMARSESGTLLWEKRVPTNFYIPDALVVDGVVCAYGRGLAAFDAPSGTLLWQSINPSGVGGAYAAACALQLVAQSYQDHRTNNSVAVPPCRRCAGPSSGSSRLTDAVHAVVTRRLCTPSVRGSTSWCHGGVALCHGGVL